MKKIATWGMPLIAAWALSACGTTSSNAPAQQPTQPVAATETAPRAEAAVERFTCENGLNVQLRPLGQDQLELHLDDKRAALVRAVSGSGERYVATRGLFGRGAEWHQKGGEAFFSFTDAGGRKVETPCRAMN